MEIERRAAKRDYFKRKRSQLPKKEHISRALYGKENHTKLTYTVQANTASDGIWKTVYPLVATLRLSNDWNNFENSYQNYNIVKVKVQIITGSSQQTADAYTNTHFMGLAYSGRDSNAVTNINQLADYQNYSVWSPVNADASLKHFFKFRPRPKIRPPQPTSDTTENFGWIKAYSSNIGNTSVKDCAYLVFVFTCIFSGEA